VTIASIITTMIGLSLACVFGYAMTTYLVPTLPRHLRWALAPGIGLGFCSLLFVLFRRPMFTVETALAVPALWYLFRRKFRHKRESVQRPSAIILVLAAAMVLAATGLVERIERIPHGEWDGWAIWNTHARILFRDGSNWKNDIKHTFHPDYPLLSPSITARFWRYAGQEIPEEGALIGVVLALSGAAVLASTVGRLRDNVSGVLLGVMLVSTPLYLQHASSQYADVPLSFFFLSTIALIGIYAEHNPDKRVLVLAGFTAGCAAWTKNEGLLFAAAVCAALALPVLRMGSKLRARLIPFGTGLALPLAITIFFKAAVLGQSDLIGGQSNTAAKLLDLSRHQEIIETSMRALKMLGQSFGQWSISAWVPLILFLLYRGVDRRALQNLSCLTGLMTLGIVIAGYYVVYLVTPQDLAWHLGASIDRLLLHLWPSALLLAGLAVPREERGHKAVMPQYARVRG
jgi:hypothetical protein